MPWSNDTYYYTIGALKRVATNYDDYEAEALSRERHFSWDKLETKIDFDRAFESLGRKEKKVIAVVIENDSDFGELRKQDFVLQTEGFYDIPKFRKRVFRAMLLYLNGYKVP